MKKTFAFFLVVLFLVSVIYVLDDSSKNIEAEPDPKYKTVNVIQGNLIIKISATGVVEPNFQVEVKSKASGEVLSFPYEEGDFVGKGNLLLERPS